MNRFCNTDGDNVTLQCFVDGHVVTEDILYTDGSWMIVKVEDLDRMVYTGTPESRKEIREWMIASACNPRTPFGYQPGMVLEDGRPGFILRPGMTVYRDPTGKFAAK